MNYSNEIDLQSFTVNNPLRLLIAQFSAGMIFTQTQLITLQVGTAAFKKKKKKPQRRIPAY